MQSLVVVFMVYVMGYGYKDGGRSLVQCIHNKISKISVGRGNEKFIIFAIAICYSQVVYLLYDPIFNKPKIVNEYYSIPEETLVGGKYYDNTKYFNWAIKSPVTYKYDVVGGDIGINTVPLNKSQLNMIYPHESDVKDNSISQIFYDKNNKSTSFNIIDGYNVPVRHDNPDLYKVISEITKRNVSADTSRYSRSIKKFLENNKFELHQQVLSRFMIHHHNFILAPVNELYYGKDVKKIIAQYGLGGALVIGKIMTFFGGITLHGWLKLCYAFYLIYYIVFIFVSYDITKSRYFTFIVFVMSVAIMNSRGYDILILPPGDSPWRAFMDVVILFLLYRFGASKKIYYFYLSLIMAEMAIVINPQFGVMMLLAAVGAATFYAVYEKRGIAKILSISLLAIIFGSLIYIKSNTDSGLSKYYLDGMVGVRIEYQEVLYYIIMFMFGYYLLFRSVRVVKNSEYISSTYMLFYSQAMFLYVIWHYNNNGITSRFHIYILTIMLLLYRSKIVELIDGKVKWLICRIASVALLSYYLFTVVEVIKSKYEYDKIFKTHRTYEWKFSRASIISTMNPGYFEEASELIKQYMPRERGIYIISKYDNILPFISEKYSMMPFFDMTWYSITDKEVLDAVNIIRKNKPDFVFVDTDIYRNFNNDYLDPRIPVIGYLAQESIWRVQRLRLLYKIYEGISGEYQLVKKGTLISIYKRI
jgi:hypothetical protein